MDEKIWDSIKQAFEVIKNTEIVNRIDVVKKSIVVYAVPSPNNPKNMIRIDIKINESEDK